MTLTVIRTNVIIILFESNVKQGMTLTQQKNITRLVIF